MRKRRLSLATMIAIPLVGVTTITLSIFGAYNYNTTRKHELDILHRRVRSQADMLAIGLALPVWNIDRAQIDRIIEASAGTSSNYAISVDAARRTHHRVRDAGWKFVVGEPAPDPTLLVEHRMIVFNDAPIGEVHLYATPKFIEQELRQELLHIVSMIVIVDALLILLIYLVLYRVVLAPLHDIERYAMAVSAEEENDTVTREPASTQEMENLGSAIERMIQLLAQRYAELQEQMIRRLESEERFGKIFDSVNDAILLTTPDGESIIDVNVRFCEMFGYSRAECLSLRLADLGAGDNSHRQQSVEEMLRAAQEGPQVFEWLARHRDQHLFWTEISTRTATLDGRLRIIVVLRNVDERKEMEQALRRSETMSVMGALVGGVAHEVRNPLFGITSMLDAYGPELSQGELQEFEQGLRQQVTRLTQLMTELLEFGRPATTTLTPGALHHLIAEVVKGRERQAREANVVLHSNLPDTLPLIAMDARRLRQVFENLIDNALQHAPAVRNVQIDARLVSQGDRHWIECSVSDDGTGFDHADLPRVFEPFFTKRERGVGLGLPIVQRIVEEHAGRVSAANRPERGAMITIRLPLPGSRISGSQRAAV